MSFDVGLLDWVTEALEPIGAVTMRRMMGAATLYCDGAVFAVIDGDEIWFKGDAQSAAEWDAAGCERFVVGEKGGEPVTMNYRRGPADVYDDADAMRGWAALAIEAGQRAAAKKKPRKARAVPA